MILQYTTLVENNHHYLVSDEPLEMNVRPGTKIEFLYPIKEDAEETYQLFAIVR
jgi:hypothetical protein